MQELIARLGAIFSQLGEQVQAALQNPDTGAAIAAAIDVILPVACGILRVVAIPIAILIIVLLVKPAGLLGKTVREKV